MTAIRSGLLLLLAIVSYTLLAPPATAATPRPVLLGVSDSGQAADYQQWTELLQRPVPVLQTFHTWGNSLRRAGPRWQELQVLPILHLSTNGLSTPPTLAAIAAGAEDQYLLQLRSELFAFGWRVIIRPLGEPNRPLNNYSAFLPNGQRRGPGYTPGDYRRAFRRIAIILRAKNVDQQLALARLPLLAPTAAAISPPGKVTMLWSPLPGREKIRGNGPHNFWPGKRWVNAVGTSFFSAWPYWSELNKMRRRWQNFPFWLAEWGLHSDSAKFVSQVHRWCQRQRCRGLVYYRGFGPEIYQLENHPTALWRLRWHVADTERYPLYYWQDN